MVFCIRRLEFWYLILAWRPDRYVPVRQILKWSFIKFFGAYRKWNFINFYRKTQRDRSKFKHKPSSVVAAYGDRIRTKFSDKQIRDLNNTNLRRRSPLLIKASSEGLTGFASERSNAPPPSLQEARSCDWAVFFASRRTYCGLKFETEFHKADHCF